MSFRRAVREVLVNLNQKYRLDYIFIHINKTGGTSIEKALGVPLDHKTAIEVRDIIGPRRWNERFSFAFVRNPWDKVVSHYSYRIATNQTGMGENTIAFDDWVRLAYRDRDPEYFDKPKMFLPQYEWVADENGQVIVDFIGRFERINEDFATVAQKLGRQLSLPHVKSSKRTDYREYYTDESAEIILEYFMRDIEYFGYAFDGGEASDKFSVGNAPS
jgi:hypothetical protein